MVENSNAHNHGVKSLRTTKTNLELSSRLNYFFNLNTLIP
jgi:hypothetical protein